MSQTNSSGARRFALNSRFRANETALWIEQSALAAPELRQRPVFAEDRIAVRQGHLRNHGQRLVPLGRIIAAAKIVGAVRRIGADDNKIVAARKLLMSGARR